MPEEEKKCCAVVVFLPEVAEASPGNWMFVQTFSYNGGWYKRAVDGFSSRHEAERASEWCECCGSRQWVCERRVREVAHAGARIICLATSLPGPQTEDTKCR